MVMLPTYTKNIKIIDIITSKQLFSTYRVLRTLKDKDEKTAVKGDWSFLSAITDVEKSHKDNSNNSSYNPQSRFADPFIRDRKRIIPEGNTRTFVNPSISKSTIRATVKERQVFNNLFENLLSKEALKSKNATVESTRAEKKENVQNSHQVQAVFEKTFTNIINKQKSRNGALSSSSNQSSISITNKDIREFPMSVSSMFIDSDQTRSTTSIKDMLENQKLRKALLEALNPTFKHMKTFKLDYDLIKFIRENILEKFKIYEVHQKAINKKLKGEETKVTPNDIEINNLKEVLPHMPIVDSRTLPLLLQEGIRLLAEEYGCVSGALSMFEEAKKNDNINIYIYGCTTDIYNEIIKIRWEYYKDIFGIDLLINEMELNGIKGNRGTADILKSVSSEMHNIQEGTYSIHGIGIWCDEDTGKLGNIDKYLLELMKRYAVDS